MSTPQWYYAVESQRIGPVALTDLVEYVSDSGGPKTFVYGPGFTAWQPAGRVVQVVEAVKAYRRGDLQPTTDNKIAAAASATAKEVKSSQKFDYRIHGNDCQFVEVALEPNETVVAEAGAMMYVGPGIKMETVFGDPSKNKKGGIAEKMMSAGKRIVTGESLFLTTFTNLSRRRALVAFAAPYQGTILPLNLKDYQGEIICQKDAMLCSTSGIEIDVAFQKKIGAALLGGEGFIMQRLKGSGTAMIHAGGSLRKIDLQHGDKLRVDTGCLVAMTTSVTYDIEFAKDIKSAFFGGEGVVVATTEGPGTVWLQSLPFSRLASRMVEYSRQLGSKSGGEGSLLGGVFNLVSGD